MNVNEFPWRLTTASKKPPGAATPRGFCFFWQNSQKRVPQIVKSVAEVRLKPPEKRHIIAVSTE
jgi:hypothetical protein